MGAYLTAFLLLLAGPAFAQGTLLDVPGEWRNATGGAVCSGCKLYAYITGTTTPLDTYSDAALTTANANPVVLDSAGRATVYLSDRVYKLVLTTSAGVTIWTRDPVVGVAPPATILSKTADYTVAATDGKDVLIKADASGGAFTVTLYTAVGNAGRIITVKKTDSSYLSVTLDPFSTQTIDGASTVVLDAPGDTIAVQSDGANWITLFNTSSVALEPRAAEGRLTLESGVCVSTTDQSAKTTIYYTPCRGNRLAVYTSVGWVWRTFAELSESIAGCTASRPYDVFAYDNAGTIDLETAIWTSTTARFSSGAYAALLPTQDGVRVKSTDGAAIDATRRYLGTFLCNASGGQTDDSLAKRYVWNEYNRATRPMRVLEATNSWTYNTATLRQANASTANQLDLVVGVAEDALDVQVIARTTNGGSNETVVVAIGEDSTTAAASGSVIAMWNSTTGPSTQLVASYRTVPAIGRHYYAWLEYASNGATATWYGDGNQPTLQQTGILGLWRN